MNDFANVVGGLAWDALWQSSAILVLGLVVARCLVRQAARAHAVLALALVAAIATPIASQIVRRGGWGLLPPDRTLAELERPGAPQRDTPAMIAPAVHETLLTTFTPGDTETEGVISDRPRQGAPGEAFAPSEPMQSAPAAALVANIAPPSNSGFQDALRMLPAALGAMWLAATLLLAVRLLRGVFAGRRLLATAVPCSEPSVVAALEAACERLDIAVATVGVYQSSVVRCPIIWCWGGRPRLLLPVDAVQSWTAARWTPVLCHELAHHKRRDHWAALTAEVVGCLVPWQGLAWWAKRRLECASEQACDDWTVAAGHSAVDYAEVLLGLAAQAEPPLALAALRRRSGLAARIQHIVTQAVPRPNLGRLWGMLLVAAAVTGVGAAAVCQRGVVRADAPAGTVAVEPSKNSADAEGKKLDAAKPGQRSSARRTSAPAMASRSPKGASVNGVFVAGAASPAGGVSDETDNGKDSAESGKPQLRKATGRVVGPDGQPVAGAEVYWEARYKPARPNTPWEGPKVVARGTTNSEGEFALEGTLGRQRLGNTGLVVRAAGFGLRAYSTSLEKLEQPLEIQLEPAYSIEGTIFTPNGEPVKQASVRVQSIYRHVDREAVEAERKKAWYLTLTRDELASEKPRDYWPTPVTTDDEGKFRFDDFVPRSAVATMTVFVEDFAPTRVAVAGPESSKSDYETFRDAKFTLVLESPYIIEGRFLDEKTNEPIPAVRLTVMPMSNRRGGSTINQIESTGDDEGRYRFRLGSADSYWVKIYPPLGYAGINQSISSRQIEQLAGAGRKVKYEVKLRRGVIVRGRVVADDTREPVEGAGVVYQALRKRKLGVNSEFRPVETDADGKFEVTVADGTGFLLVDAPGMGFYRVTLDDSRVNEERGPLSPHGYLEIDVPAEGSIEPYEIAVRRGPELVARAIGPDGKPVKKLVAAYIEQNMDPYFQSDSCPDGVFRLNAAEPGRTYRVFLYSEDANAGVVAELVAPTDGKTMDVQLLPCATVRGRYIYDGGTPAPEVTNFSHFRSYPDQRPDGDSIYNLPFYSNFARHQSTKRVTDDNGEFVLDNIVPDVFLYLHGNFSFGNGKKFHEVGTLAPGEVKDVGDLVITP